MEVLKEEKTIAQNMAALRALATEGIQRGHVPARAPGRHRRGYKGDMINKVAAQMVAEKVVRIDGAEEILKGMK